MEFVLCGTECVYDGDKLIYFKEKSSGFDTDELIHFDDERKEMYRVHKCVNFKMAKSVG